MAREESHKHRYAYYYGFQAVYGTINKIILLSLLGLMLNIFPQVMIVALSFAMLRIWSGGLHFNNYTLCAYASLISLVVMGLLAKYIMINPILIFVIVLVMFVFYAPAEHPNRPLSHKEKTWFKIIAIIILFILFGVQLCISDSLVSNSIAYGVLLAGIIVKIRIE